jgi:predicted outer membrane protein
MRTIILLIFCIPLLANAETKMSSAEALGKVFNLSNQAVNLGKIAKLKLSDMQLKSFNNRMLEDHQISLQTIEKLASQLNIKLPEYKEDAKSVEKIEKLQGKKFALAYIDKEVDLHQKLLTLIEDEIVPHTDSLMVKKVMNNFTPRLDTLLENAKKQRKF